MVHNKQERELNLLDLFCYVLLKWRVVLIVSIIFAVLLAGYSYYNSSKQIKKQNSNVEEKIVLQEVNELMVVRYVDYMGAYEKQIAYNEESYLMGLDSNGFYEGVVEYYIQGAETNLALQGAIEQAYHNVLQNEVFYSKIRSVVGQEVKESYYNEIVDYTNEIEGVVYNYQTYEQSDDGVLRIKVRAQAKEQSEQLVALVKEEIKNAYSNVSSKLGSHSIVELGANISFVADPTVFLYQKYNVEKAGTYNSVVSGLENQFTDKELAYAKQKLKERETKVDTTIINEDPIENKIQSMPKQNIKPTISIKIVVVGFCLGGFLAVVWYAFLYLVNGALRLENNFDKSYGVKLLGCVKADNNNKKRVFGFVDKWILCMRYRNVAAISLGEAIPMIVTNIKIACEKAGKKELTITKSGVSEMETVVMEAIAEKLSKEGILAVQGNTILQDWAALESAAKTSLLVLVETANKTSAFSMQREIDACRSQGTMVIGTVVVTE